MRMWVLELSDPMNILVDIQLIQHQYPPSLTHTTTILEGSLVSLIAQDFSNV